MRTIGLLGGMSWESSALYYRYVNELVRERLGGLHSARCLLYSVEFGEIEPLQTAGRWDEIGEVVAGAARALEVAGADMVVICSNTTHKVADQAEAAVSIPLVHVADVTAKAVRAAGLGTVGLLGSIYTMEQDFLRTRLERHGLCVLVPGRDDRVMVNRVLFDELCLGVVTQESRDAFLEVIERLADAGAQGVILGCTEIDMLVDDGDAKVPLFSTTRLHAEAAVELALAD